MTDETMIDRIDQRLATLGMTDREVSILATGKPDLIRDMRRRGGTPRMDALEGLANALETTVEWLKYGRSTGAAVADRRTGYEAPPGSPTEPRDIRAFGTALGGGEVFGGTVTVETHILELTDAIDWLRRPPSLAGRNDVYGLFVSGSSMEPRFDSGDPVIVDPRKPPRPGDDVVVQLARSVGDDGEVHAALIKTLVRRTATYLELMQYNPKLTFQVPLDRVAGVHRVLSRNDMVG